MSPTPEEQANEVMEDITDDANLCIIRDALEQYFTPTPEGYGKLKEHERVGIEIAQTDTTLKSISSMIRNHKHFPNQTFKLGFEGASDGTPLLYFGWEE